MLIPVSKLGFDLPFGIPERLVAEADCCAERSGESDGPQDVFLRGLPSGKVGGEFGQQRF